MVKWFKSLFAWREVFRAGVHAYEENSITGERRCWRYISGGHSPKDANWLKKIEPGPLTPPTGGLSIGK